MEARYVQFGDIFLKAELSTIKSHHLAQSINNNISEWLSKIAEDAHILALTKTRVSPHDIHNALMSLLCDVSALEMSHGDVPVLEEFLTPA